MIDLLLNITKLRTNRYKSSKIDNIPGIGPSKENFDKTLWVSC